jgi:hypothetical protein
MNSILSYLTFTIPSSFIKQPYFLSFFFSFSFLYHFSFRRAYFLSEQFLSQQGHASGGGVNGARRAESAGGGAPHRCTTSLTHCCRRYPLLLKIQTRNPTPPELQARRSILPFTVELADPRHRPRQRPTVAFTSPTNQTAGDRRHIAGDQHTAGAALTLPRPPLVDPLPETHCCRSECRAQQSPRTMPHCRSSTHGQRP